MRAAPERQHRHVDHRHRLAAAHQQPGDPFGCAGHGLRDRERQHLVDAGCVERIAFAVELEHQEQRVGAVLRVGARHASTLKRDTLVRNWFATSVRSSIACDD